MSDVCTIICLVVACAISFALGCLIGHGDGKLSAMDELNTRRLDDLIEARKDERAKIIAEVKRQLDEQARESKFKHY